MSPMRRTKLILIFLLAALIVSVAGCSSLQPCENDSNCTQVLFLGNSYTFVNDLPQMFASLAKAGGHRVEVDMAAEGGMTLADHAKSQTTVDKIKSSKWDFVVLQEQSQIPAVMEVRNAQMYPPARTLVSLIRENGAEPVFYMTWGYRNGWPDSGLTSYESMQQGLYDGYMSIVHELKTRVAPVGVAWAEAHKKNPQVNLWQDDGSHPAVQGTYLTVCVFYATIFGESPEGLSYRGDLSKDEAQWLQKIAADAVLQDKSRWNIP